jgi:hypothetical protein
MGSRLPLSGTGPSGSTAGGWSMALSTASDMTMSPGREREQSREPTFTVSPTTAYWRRMSLPTCAATTSPVCTPIA